MKRLHVLVVDDSALNRRLLSDVLESIAGVESVELASDGAAAIRAVERRVPDMITLDLEMPGLDGFKFLQLLEPRHAVPVVVVSGHAQRENVFRALELGALDFVPKPRADDASAQHRFRDQLRDKVRLVRRLSPLSPRLQSNRASLLHSLPPEKAQLHGSPSQLVVVAASTGGPTAIVSLLRNIDTSSASLVIAQHMPEGFTRTFAERLNRLNRLTVTEVQGFTTLTRGRAYVCPGGRCLEVATGSQGPALRLVDPTSQDRYVPSADRLFETAAKVMGGRVIGVVLTGMGDDGAVGARAIKAQGGIVLVQRPDTAVVSGMPEAASEGGGADIALPLDGLAARLEQLIAPGR